MKKILLLILIGVLNCQTWNDCTVANDDRIDRNYLIEFNGELYKEASKSGFGSLTKYNSLTDNFDYIDTLNETFSSSYPFGIYQSTGTTGTSSAFIKTSDSLYIINYGYYAQNRAVLKIWSFGGSTINLLTNYGADFSTVGYWRAFGNTSIIKNNQIVTIGRSASTKSFIGQLNTKDLATHETTVSTLFNASPADIGEMPLQIFYNDTTLYLITQKYNAGLDTGLTLWEYSGGWNEVYSWDESNICMQIGTDGIRTYLAIESTDRNSTDKGLYKLCRGKVKKMNVPFADSLYICGLYVDKNEILISVSNLINTNEDKLYRNIKGGWTIYNLPYSVNSIERLGDKLFIWHYTDRQNFIVNNSGVLATKNKIKYTNDIPRPTQSQINNYFIGIK